MEKYEKYKDSGVDWIGDIPEHWGQGKLKNFCSLKGRIGWNGLRSDEFQQLSYAYLVTGQDFTSDSIDWSRCYQIDQARYEEDPFIQLANGDILITKDGTIGKIATVKNLDKPACLNSGIFVMKQTRGVFSQDYLYWLLVSDMLKEFNKYTSSGTTILHLYQNVFERMPVVVPPIDEQEEMASFLASECSKIDSLIATQQKRVELLKELRQSVITKAVTKGLNLNAKMKDSGVEWIGDIPARWTTIKTKYIGTIRSGDSLPSSEITESGEFEVYGGNGLAGYCGMYNIQSDKVIIGRVGALCGNVRKSKGKRFITDNALIFSCYDRIDIDYLTVVLDCANLNNLNTSSAQPLITGTKVLNVFIPLPSIDEQKQIVSFIEKQQAQYDVLISATVREIELLKEYKQSLITEVVTGKRKVC